MLWNFLADLRYGARAVKARPTFAAVVMLTLALGIGVNVAIFSLLQQILLRSLPVVEPDRLVNLSSPGPKLDPETARGYWAPSITGGVDSLFSYPMFRDLERVQQPFVGIAAHHTFNASLSTGDRAQPGTGTLVSGSYFALLGVQPALGRLLGPGDDRVDGQAESVVLSDAFWRSAFGGDPDVVGRPLIVNGATLTIVGVTPPGFYGATVGVRPNVFAPITLRVDIANQNGEQGARDDPHVNRGAHWVHLFARLEQGVTREEAAAAIDPPYRAILNEIEAPLSEVKPAAEIEAFRTKPMVLEPGARGQSVLLVSARGRLEMLFAVSGIVLFLCCANVAGLMLLRGSARTGEMAVRASMGATRGRLASLLFAESMLLALPAALLSLPVALLTLRGIASGRWGIPAAAFDVNLDLGGALVAIGVALGSAVAFGHFPIRSLTRTEPGHTLQAYGVRQTSGRGVARFRRGLATVQIALSMALLAMTVALAQSLANIARVEPGFEVDSLVTFTISPRASEYPADASARLLESLEDAVAAIPGVSAAASSAFPLLTGRENGVMIRVVDGVELDEPRFVPFNAVSPGFFQTLGIELLAGRDFGAADAATGTRVVVVNQRFAERFGLGTDVVGASISPSPRIPSIEIVGVVADAKYGKVTGEIGPQWFTPRVQSTFGAGSATFYVRGAQPPQALMNAVRETVTRLAPNVPITDLRTMDEQIRENVATERFVGGAATAFAVLATVLAAVGLYGVLAYSVAQRSREIGLRFALGAPARSIRGMVFRQVAGMAIVGTLLGAAGAALLGRAARSVLFGVEAADPLVLAAAAFVLAGVMLGAAYLPARRATRVDPMTVLRYE